MDQTAKIALLHIVISEELLDVFHAKLCGEPLFLCPSVMLPDIFEALLAKEEVFECGLELIYVQSEVDVGFSRVFAEVFLGFIETHQCRISALFEHRRDRFVLLVFYELLNELCPRVFVDHAHPVPCCGKARKQHLRFDLEKR